MLRDEEWWKEQPAHFIKFKFSIEEQIEHEKIRYPEYERLDESLLMDNYIKLNNPHVNIFKNIEKHGLPLH